MEIYKAPENNIENVPNRAEREQNENTKSLEKAEKILAFSSEYLASLPDEEKRKLVSDLRWNSYESNGEIIFMPEEMLEAESKIYETYKPSQELQEIHKNTANEAFSLIEKNLLELSKKWIASDVDTRLEMCQEWIDKLCASYQIPKVTATSINVGEEIDTLASYYGGYGGNLGTIGFGEGRLKHNENFKDFLDITVHEIAHAFQDAAKQKLINEELKEKIKNDIEWFNLKNSRSMHRDDNAFRKSHKRYLSLPYEQDAHMAQDYFVKKSEDAFSESRNSKLAENNLLNLENINLRAKVARWANNVLSLDKDINGDKLFEIAREKLKNNGPGLVEELFGGKTNKEIRDLIDEFIKIEKEAREILDK